MDSRNKNDLMTLRVLGALKLLRVYCDAVKKPFNIDDELYFLPFEAMKDIEDMPSEKFLQIKINSKEATGLYSDLFYRNQYRNGHSLKINRHIRQLGRRNNLKGEGV
jgi:hypothetical protein